MTAVSTLVFAAADFAKHLFLADFCSKFKEWMRLAYSFLEFGSDPSRSRLKHFCIGSAQAPRLIMT